MKNSSYNLFTELNADAHPVNAKNNAMVDAINAALTTEGENQLILQNMKGNADFTALPNNYRPVGVTIFNNIAYILSAEFDADGKFLSAELGTFPSPDWSTAYTAPFDFTKPVNILPRYSAIRNFLPNSKLPPGASQSLINSILNDDQNYTWPFNSNKFDLKSDRMVELEIQPSYDDSVNIIITDNYNPIRLINSRFKVLDGGKKALIADRRQTKDTNTYSDSRFTATKLLRTADTVASLTFNGVGNGGHHKGGGYRFYFRYIDTDGTLSDIMEESRLVVIAHDKHGARPDENTGKLIKFTLSNLDRKFAGIKVYFSKGDDLATAVTTVFEIANIYDIKGDSIAITIFGNELTTPYNAEKLNVNYSNIYSVRTMTQFDDRLILGNLSFNSDIYTTLRNISTYIQIKEKDELNLKIRGLGEGYANPYNVYNKLGYWGGETYEIGVVYVLNDYSLSPVFPVRGLDNFYGNNNYNSNLNLTSNLFSGSENSLGVYRTNKSKDNFFFNGDGSTTKFAADTTKVRALALDFNYLDTTKQNTLKTLTKGYFIVRKERDRDCIVQGYVTNTTHVPINQKIPTSGRYNKDTAISPWESDLDQIHIKDIDRDPIGSYNDKLPTNYKIIPTPGRLTEVHYDSNTDVTAHKSFTIQGRIIRNPSRKQQYWAFYPADQLVDPAMMSTIFNGTDKGIFINNPQRGNDEVGNVLKVNSIVAGNSRRLSAVGLANSNGLIYTYPNDTDDPGPNKFGADDGTNIYLVLLSSGAGVQTWRFTAQNIIVNPGGLSSNDNVDIRFTFSVGETGNVISCVPGVSGNEDSFEVFVDISGSYFPFIKEGDSGNVGNYFIKITGGKYDGDNVSVDAQFLQRALNISSATFVDADSSDISAADPVKVLNLNSFNIDFNWLSNPADNDPTIIEEKRTIKYRFKYIGYATDAYSKDQFSAIEDRNVYYVGAKIRYPDGGPNWYAQAKPNMVEGGKPSTGPACSDLFTSIHQYSEYIGLESYSDVEIKDENVANYYLYKALANDSENVNNYTNQGTNGGTNGTGLVRYKERIQTNGFNLGTLINVYDSINGPLSTLDWISKYGVGSNTDVYFAVTERKLWNKELEPNATANERFVKFYSGDCYVAHVYKRIMLPRGIPGVDTATNPSLYMDFNQNTGLMPDGFFMPIVSENNYNVALRIKDNSYANEKILYNDARTFYPLESNVDKLRSSKQKESTAYNFGYNDNFHDKVFVSLNDRSPAFNTNYTNRVMVSSPSVSGSFTNGYLDFSGLNFRDYNKQLGQIIKLISHNNDVYCVFEQGVGIIPINQRTMVSEQDSGVFIDNAQVLAPKMQILSTEYGSDQQFSIVKTDQALYGCDLRKNKIWRVTKEGLTIISDFAVQSIIKESKERLLGINLVAPLKNSALNFVKANYDRELNHVMFSYLNIDLKNKITADYIRNNKQNEPTSGKVADTLSIVEKSNKVATIYWNETLQKWVSKLSWNPLWAFNIQNKLYSFNALKDSHKLWQHFSTAVPYCNFYGEQEKFIFEFILVDKPSMQKLLHNLTVVSNRVFPTTVEYKLLENDYSFENGSSVDNSYKQYIHQRKEFIDPNKIQFTVETNTGKLLVRFNNLLTEEEANRLEGAWFVGSNGLTYILGAAVSFNGLFYNEVKDENGNFIYGPLPTPITFTMITFGIIHQNADYIEDELYIEVDHGKFVDPNSTAGKEKSRIRDKAIKIKLTYEGYDYVTVQTVVSSFLYSFN
jgi:hypothetical protein